MKKIFKSGKIFELDEVDSTNNYASLLSVNTPEGSIVWALEQTQGRGQGKNRWESEPGKNLTFSIVLYPTFLDASDQFYISKIISLALADFISRFAENVCIKWPNDIYINEKKIAGILIENSIERHYIKQSIVGIGINLNQKKFTGNAPNPLSLWQHTGREYNLRETLLELWDLIDNRYSLLIEKNNKIIDNDYLRSLYRFNKIADYRANGKQFSGKIVSIEKEGGIVIRDEKNTIRKFMYKEVEFL